MTEEFDRSDEELDIKNAQEYLDKRRLMDIMDAQLRVIIRRNDALDHEPFERRAILYEAVRDYIWLSKSIFLKVDGGIDYWSGNLDAALGYITHPDLGRLDTIEGLQEFLHADPPWEVEVTETEDDIVAGESETEYVEMLHMPTDISMRAFELTNDFLQVDAQLDVKIGPAGHVSEEAGL